MLNRNDTMYLFFVGLLDTDILKTLTDCNIPYNKEGLWYKFISYMQSGTIRQISDEQRGYIYRISQKGGNNLLFFDPFYNNNELQDIYLNSDNSNKITNDYCNIVTFLNSDNIDKEIKINYLYKILNILNDQTYETLEVSQNPEIDKNIFGYFRGRAVPWIHWKKSNYNDYFKFYIMTPREFYDYFIVSIINSTNNDNINNENVINENVINENIINENIINENVINENIINENVTNDGMDNGNVINENVINGGKLKYNKSKKNKKYNYTKRSRTKKYNQLTKYKNNKSKKLNKKFMKGGDKNTNMDEIIDIIDVDFDNKLIDLTNELVNINFSDSFEVASIITNLAMDGFVNKYELIKLNIQEKYINDIMATCNKYFTQYSNNDHKIYDFIKNKNASISEELIAKIIKQKKIKMTPITFNSLFGKYINFDDNTINELINL